MSGDPATASSPVSNNTVELEKKLRLHQDWSDSAAGIGWTLRLVKLSKNADHLIDNLGTNIIS